MALRNIVTLEDPILRKTSRKVEKFDKRLWDLLDDMKDTLYNANGAGLAAVQGGTLSITADGDLFKAEVCLPAITDGSADAKIAPAQRTPVDPVSASPASAAPAYTAPAPVTIPVRPQTPAQPERQEATCDTAPCNTTAAVAPSAADTAEEAAPAETESAPETADSPADSKADDSADIQ